MLVKADAPLSADAQLGERRTALNAAADSRVESSRSPRAWKDAALANERAPAGSRISVRAAHRTAAPDGVRAARPR